MDHSIQDLEFLNLEGLDDDTACSLRSFLVEDELHDTGEEGQLVQQGPEVIQGGFEEVEQPHYHNLNHGDITVTMGMPISTMGYHMQHPAANTMVNHHPAMYGYMNHQPTIMSYPGMFPTTGPNYYVSPGPAPGFPTHQMNNSPSYGGYQQGGGGNHNKRKPGGGAGGRSRFSPRKEIPNGHHHGGEQTYYHHPGPSAYHHHHNGPYFPNNIVQAATGLPIVMHPQPVPTYMPSHPAPQVQVTAPASPIIYQHLTFAQSPLPAEVVATLAAPPEEVEEPPPPPQEIPPPPPVLVHEEVIIAPEPAPPPHPSVPSPPPPKEEPVVAAVVTSPEIAPPAAVEMPEEPVVVESGAKSWASLFKKPASSGIAPPSIDKPTARVEPFTATVPIANHVKPSGPVAASAESSRRPKVDVKTRRLAEHLSNYELVTTPLPLLPRGLINKGNWCYINATLQALIACPSFVHLIKSLASFSNANSKGEESITPVIDSVVDFIDQFETVPVKTGKERASAKKEEPHFGTSFEPSSIYRMLSKIRSEAFKVEGRQEDAEEFLGCLLNGLHDEMIEVLKAVKGTNGSEASSQPAPAAAEAKPSTPDDEDWQVIGPKNRGCVTRSTSVSKTPISNLFLGMMRSALHAHSTHSSEFEPYFTLQLDIQNEKVNSVRDALACLVAKEPLTGYVCSKSGQEVEASRQTTFEELPPILILHLKCFVYDKSGGCQKLLKRVDFSSDLELSKDFLSPNQKSKLKERQRQYKLFAVVYHDGKEATKGHYVTEVHHTGTGSWLRFDDSLIRVVDTQLFKYNLPRMPYLLLYRKVNV